SSCTCLACFSSTAGICFSVVSETNCPPFCFSPIEGIMRGGFGNASSSYVSFFVVGSVGNLCSFGSDNVGIFFCLSTITAIGCASFSSCTCLACFSSTAGICFSIVSETNCPPFCFSPIEGIMRGGFGNASSSYVSFFVVGSVGNLCSFGSDNVGIFFCLFYFGSYYVVIFFCLSTVTSLRCGIFSCYSCLACFFSTARIWFSIGSK